MITYDSQNPQDRRRSTRVLTHRQSLLVPTKKETLPRANSGAQREIRCIRNPGGIPACHVHDTAISILGHDVRHHPLPEPQVLNLRPDNHGSQTPIERRVERGAGSVEQVFIFCWGEGTCLVRPLTNVSRLLRSRLVSATRAACAKDCTITIATSFVVL